MKQFLDILTEGSAYQAFGRWARLVEADGKKLGTKTKQATDINLNPNQTSNISKASTGSVAGDTPKLNRRSTPPKIKMPTGGPQYQINPAPKSSTDDDLGDLPYNEPVPPPPNTLPKVQSRDLATDWGDIEWTKVSQLPRYAQQMIRNIGRQVFAAFGEAPLEKIDVISTMTNDMADLDKIAASVKDGGQVAVSQAQIDFKNVIPGYKPTVSVWSKDGRYYMFVKDDHGNYIYTWEASPSNKLQHVTPAGNTDSNMSPERKLLNKLDNIKNRPNNNSQNDDLDDLLNSLY